MAFPDLLYPFYAVTIVRLTAACVLLVIAWRVYSMREEMAAVHWPIVGRTKSWVIQAGAVVTGIVGLFVFTGAHTQIAAIIGALIALKLAVLSKYHKAVLPFSRTTYVMLFFICLSLIFSGAGALGFDLPL